jgi:hypothetical protein
MLGAALAICGSQAAYGQAAGTVPPRVLIDIPSQPLTIGLRQDVLYDTNIVQGSAKAARLRGLEKAEFIVTPSATVDFGHNDGRWGASFNGVFGYDFHDKNTILDRERIEFTGTGSALLGSSCSVNARYWELRKQTRQQDLTTIVTANRVRIYVTTVGQTCTTAGGLTGTVQLLRSAWHNSSELNINNDRKAVSALLGYTDSGFGTIGATFLYERTDFFGRPAIMVMTPDTLEKTNVGIQYTSPVGRRLSGSLAAGYVYSDATAPADSRLAGPRKRNGAVAQATLLYKATDRLRISAQGARKIRHDTSFTITTDLQLSAEYALTPTIQATLGGRWLRDRYFGRDVTLPQIAQDLQDQTTLYGSLAFKVAPRTTLTADVRHDIGQANFSPFDYSGTRFMLTLASTLADPFR